MSADGVWRFHSQDLSIRAAVAISTTAVQKISEAHAALPIARVAMGRLVSGAAVLAAHAGEGVVVGVRVQGDGPLGFLYAEANHEGQVRAHCAVPQLDVALPKTASEEDARRLAEGNISIAAAVGSGTFSVTRSLPFETQPFVATVPIVSGEIGNDLAWYLQQSFQIPSIVSVGVVLGSDGRVTGAGAVLIELMPGASEFTIRMLERNAEKAPSLSRTVESGATPEEILRNYVGEMSMVRTSGEDRSLRFVCRCSAERVERALLLLGAAEISELIAKAEPVSAKCEFCNRNWTVNLERLGELQASAKTSPR